QLAGVPLPGDRNRDFRMAAWLGRSGAQHGGDSSGDGSFWLFLSSGWNGNGRRETLRRHWGLDRTPSIADGAGDHGSGRRRHGDRMGNPGKIRRRVVQGVRRYPFPETWEKTGRKTNAFQSAGAKNAIRSGDCNWDPDFILFALTQGTDPARKTR